MWDNHIYRTHGKIMKDTMNSINDQSATLPPNATAKGKSAKRMGTVILIGMAIIATILLGVRHYNRYRFHVEKDVRLIMDTYVSIYAVGPSKITSPALAAAFARMEEVDRKFSRHDPGSPVAAFNETGIAITDPEIVAVIQRALEISRQTNGAFDITISPVIDLWGFYTDETPRVPEETSIEEALNRVGYQYLRIENNTVYKDREGVTIDLGGIAKGYSVAQAADVLRNRGVTSALIDAGGDVYALGGKGKGSWRVGIRNPRAAGLLGYVEAKDMAILGSGDYERFFIKDGRRYHHIIDPGTGFPASQLSGVTILHQDPMLADAWATAVFVLGVEKGLDAMKFLPGAEAILVTANGRTVLTPELENQLMQVPQEK